jgi:hypothetical protein
VIHCLAIYDSCELLAPYIPSSPLRVVLRGYLSHNLVPCFSFGDQDPDLPPYRDEHVAIRLQIRSSGYRPGARNDPGFVIGRRGYPIDCLDDPSD